MIQYIQKCSLTEEIQDNLIQSQTSKLREVINWESTQLRNKMKRKKKNSTDEQCREIDFFFLPEERENEII